MNEEQVFRELVDGVSDYLHGEGRDAIVAAMAESGKDPSSTMAAITYEILTQVAGQLEEQAPDMVDIEMLLAVATNAIDFLIEIAEAMNVAIGEGDDVRADTLMKVVELHMAAVQDDPEELAAAEELLAMMMEDGTFNTGADYINKRLRKEGADPSQVQQQGHAMAAGRPNELSAGVQRGLMDQQQGGPQQ